MTWSGVRLPTADGGLQHLPLAYLAGHEKTGGTSSKQVLTDPRMSDLTSHNSVQFGQGLNEYDTTKPANVRSMAMYGKQ